MKKIIVTTEELVTLGLAFAAFLFALSVFCYALAVLVVTLSYF